MADRHLVVPVACTRACDCCLPVGTTRVPPDPRPLARARRARPNALPLYRLEPGTHEMSTSGLAGALGPAAFLQPTPGETSASGRERQSIRPRTAEAGRHRPG